jgi:hypothetical protein
MNKTMNIQIEKDPERYGVWLPKENQQIMLQVMEEEPVIDISISKITKVPKTKSTPLWSGSKEFFIQMFNPDERDPILKRGFIEFVIEYCAVHKTKTY